MLARLSTAVVFDAYFTATKAGKTGLTVTVDVYDYSNTKIVTAAAATEIGGGLYTYTLTSGNTANAGNYRAIFKTADATVDVQQIPALWVVGRDWVQHLDADVSSRSTYAGADTAGTTTLLTRLTATRAGYLDNLTNLDATISGIAATVWAAATRTLTAAADSAGVTTLLARLTAGRATNLDNLDAAVSTRSTYAGTDTAGVTTLVGLLTAARAGYLDKLNVTGNVAAQADVTAIQNNTLTRVSIPAFFERPDSGTYQVVLDLYVYNEHGTMQDADATPTLAVVNESGTDRSANLSVVSHPGTGRYRVTYTLHSTDAIEQLRFEWTVVVAGSTRLAGQSAFVVDTTAAYFTAADRTTLNAIGALVDVAISTRLAASSYTAPDNADIATILTDVVALLSRLPADVWDKLLANHTGAGTFGHALASGGGSGSDPWATALPAGYSAGQAGGLLAGLVATIAQFATSPLTLISPTAVAGKLDLVAGDDYKSVDGRAIVRPYSGTPLASVQLKIGDTFAVTGTVGSGTLTFQLTHLQTLDLPATSDYEIIGTTSGGSEITVERGQCTVR